MHYSDIAMAVKNIDIRNKLKRLFHKDNVLLVESGNKALYYSLQAMSKAGVKTVIVQDQGGWMTYAQFTKKLHLELEEMRTDYGLIDFESLMGKAKKKKVLLYTSMAGYFAMQDAESIYGVCKEKECFVINDASGSVGKDEACFGDIIVCSFGEGKPINNGKGGCICFNDDIKEMFEGTEVPLLELDDASREQLYQRILGLHERLMKLELIHKEIIHDLGDMEIIHREKEGINVVIKYDTEEALKNIAAYCKKKGYSYELCPRPIRVKERAVSIEVKRC